MNPQFEGETPLNPFDLWEGANFKLKVKKVEEYPNYDSSEFDTRSALLEGNETKLEEVWNKEHSLSALLDPKTFKTFDVLQARLLKVLKADSGKKSEPKESAPAKATLPKPTTKTDPLPSFKVDEGDELLADFQDLMDE
jgi:hypothetical protein